MFYGGKAAGQVDAVVAVADFIIELRQEILIFFYRFSNGRYDFG